MGRRLVVGGALIVSGLLVLTLGAYLWAASGVVCENNPDCVPHWWLPGVLVIAALLLGSGVVVAWRRER